MDDEFINRNRNININRGYRNLDIWKLGIDVYKLVFKIINNNKDIPYKVRAQIEDSALSISSNIAEGYSRRTLKESIRFYEIALSSAAENYSQMYAMISTNQIEKEEFENYDKLQYKLENKVISMNKTLIGKLKSGEEWKTDYE